MRASIRSENYCRRIPTTNRSLFPGPSFSPLPGSRSVGNHESTPGTVTNASGTFPQEYAAFATRFAFPANGNANFYYSWTYGPAFFVSFDSEHDFSAGSPQIAWLEATLAGVDRAAFPWLFLTMHHPVLSSDSDEVGDHTPGGPLSVALSPLLAKYQVDVVFQGHQHNYERTAAVTASTGEVLSLPDAHNVYTDPAGPVFIVAGTSGAVLDYEKWIPPTNWSLVRDGDNYGFGMMTLNTTADGARRVLSYTFVDIDNAVHDQWSIVKVA